MSRNAADVLNEMCQSNPSAANSLVTFSVAVNKDTLPAEMQEQCKQGFVTMLGVVNACLAAHELPPMTVVRHQDTRKLQFGY
jgi:hypothetical protein